MILVYCYDCEQVKYSLPRNLACLSCGSQLVDEIPQVYSQDEEEEDLEGEDDEEEEADFDGQSILERLANNVHHTSPMSNVNFHFIPRRASLTMDEVKFRQWVLRHLLWNGDMTQMPIEILSSPLLSQLTTTEEQEASNVFRNWVMRQVLLPQQEDRTTAFVQWIKKHILGDRTELDYRRKMRQALSFPLQDISQQETSAYRTRVFRVLGQQPQNDPPSPIPFSGFERVLRFPDPSLDDDDNDDDEGENTDDDDDVVYLGSTATGYHHHEEDEEEEEEDSNTSDDEFLDDIGYATEADRLSDTSEGSGIAHLFPGPSYNTLGLFYDFISDNHDGDDSRSVSLSALDDLISEIGTRTETSRREQQQQPSARIMQSLTEKRLTQDDPDYQTECSICQDIFAKVKLYSLPCNHIFHSECITQWIRLNPTCPICRYSLSAAAPTHESLYESFRGSPELEHALRELARQERELISNGIIDDDDDDEIHRGVDSDTLREFQRQERELFGADFEEEEEEDEDEESDDDDSDEEEEEQAQDYINAGAHIRTILELWPRDIWSDEEEEEEEEGFLSSTIHGLSPFLYSNPTSSSRYPTTTRRVIDPDDLYRPAYPSTNDLSSNWGESRRSSTNSSDSSVQYLGSTNDGHHSYYDDAIRAMTRSRHQDQQQQQLYFSDDMDIE